VQREQKAATNIRFGADFTQIITCSVIATLEYTKDSSQLECQGHGLELSDSDAANDHVSQPYVAVTVLEH
jgi:hypothetical protein